MNYMTAISKKFNKDKKNLCIFIFRYESHKGIYLMLLYQTNPKLRPEVYFSFLGFFGINYWSNFPLCITTVKVT